MKNLRVSNVWAIQLSTANDTANSDSSPTCVCIDSASDVLYILREQTIYVIENNEQVRNFVVTEDIQSRDIILFNFLYDDCVICAIIASGEIYHINCEEETCLNVSVVPAVYGGAWSPDYQLLVLIGHEEIFALTRDFDIITRVLLRPLERGKDELMTIGWGSRETQFQGAAGRGKRERIDADRVPVEVPARDDCRPLVEWRADGQFFVVSTVDELKENFANGATYNCRQLRVWDRNLELASKCEFLAGLEDSLCVRPQGNLIAATQLINDQRKVRFFERNGQYRGGFSLSGDANEMQNQIVRFIGWNNDATILVIYFREERQSRLQFYTTSNYDWALKLEYAFNRTIEHVFWDVENANRIHIVSRDCYSRIELFSTYTSETGIVCSFNGATARLTDLRLASIPSPMSHSVVQLYSAPSEFALYAGRLAVISSDRRFISFYNVSNVRNPLVEKTVRLIGFENEGFTLVGLQWRSDENGLIGKICILTRPKKVEIDLNGEVNLCKSDPNQNFDSHHEAMETPYYRYVSQLDCTLALTKRTHQLNVIDRLDGSISPIQSGVSSFCLAGDFFLVTTFTNQLFSIDLTDVVAQQRLAKTSSTISTFGLAAILSSFFKNGRQIERGAVLVDADANGTRVWLQMPRGNLETIHPRALVIRRLKRAMNALEFGEALDEIRRQRVDTNLLVDHNVEKFLENISLFLTQVKNVEHLNLFITTLKSEDTRFTMFLPYYRHCLSDEERETETAKTDTSATSFRREKIPSLMEIVARIRVELENFLANCRLEDFYHVRLGKLSVEDVNLATLSCYFVEKRISEALIHIKSQVEKVPKEPMEFLRKWINYLTVLVNEEDLFRHSLKTYDMNLTVNVLNYTNRDPKELLTVLNRFQSTEPLDYRKFCIDMYLGDYAMALEHLVPLAEVDESRFAECSTLIEQQGLHSLAFFLFYDTAKREDIYKLCAAFALKERAYDEAGWLYLVAGDVIPLAWNAFVSAHNYKACRALYDTRRVDDAIFHDSMLKIARQLIAQHKNETYLKVLRLLRAPLLQNAFSSELFNGYLNAFKWDDAYLSIQELTDREADKMMLLARLKERIAILHSQINTWSETLRRYATRLEVVRATKLRQLRAWIQQESLGSVDGLPFDAVSETESDSSSTVSVISHASKMSRFSTATSRQRKKIERKKKQIKEGSQYEDAALLTALKELYNTINSLQDELIPLLRVILSIGLIAEGRTLQRRLVTLFELANEFRTRIWPQYFEVQHLTGPIIEIYRDADGIVRPPVDGLMPSRFQIENEMIAPELRKLSMEWRLLMFETGRKKH